MKFIRRHLFWFVVLGVFLVPIVLGLIFNSPTLTRVLGRFVWTAALIALVHRFLTRKSRKNGGHHADVT